MKQAFTLLITLLITSSSMYAQPGTVDSSFGVNGTAIRNNLHGAYQDIHVRFNGKILVSRFADTTVYITQYSNQGVPEKTTKLASVDIQGPYRKHKGTFYIVQKNKDGKILGVGDITDLDETVVFIARFNKDGSLDSSFATKGIVQYSAGNFHGLLQLIVQPDSKLLLSVLEIYDAVPEIDRPVLIRYLPDGTPDSSFGTNGVVQNVIKNTSMQLQHDGKIVLGYGYKNIQLSRRKVDGSLDSSFGKKGIAQFNVPYITSPYDNFYLGQMIIQPDDKIVATGQGSIQFKANYATCTRINANGTLDSSFADNGFARTSFLSTSDYIEANRPVLQGDGKIIIGGILSVYYPPTPDSSVLLRLNTDGTLDRSFGNGGYVKNAHAQGFAIYDIALQPDGKILTCGYQRMYASDGTFLADHPSVARYNGDASINTITKAEAAKSKPSGSIVINVYPNPAANILHIYTKQSTAMFLTNSSGKTVWTGRVNVSATINVSQQPAGIYFLSIPNKQEVQKIIINH